MRTIPSGKPGLYVEVQARFADLLARYHNPEWIRERLYRAETRNLEHFGYGVKALLEKYAISPGLPALLEQIETGY